MFEETTARLLITCPDKPGIVAAVSNFFYNHGANITALDQHSTDAEGGTFFMRLEFQTPHLDISGRAMEMAFEERVGKPYGMDWRISYARERKKNSHSRVKIRSCFAGVVVARTARRITR